MFSTPAVTALFIGCKAFNFASFCLKIDKITRFDWNGNIVMPSYILKKLSRHLADFLTGRDQVQIMKSLLRLVLEITLFTNIDQFA